MKKIALVAAAILSVCTAARAQEELENTAWFVGTGVGMNFGFDGQAFKNPMDRSTSHNGAGIGNDIYCGYWFSNWGGFRAGFQGLSISDKFTDFGYKRYEYLHGDMLIRAHRNIIPYLHIGWARIDNSAFGGGGGLAFPIYVSKRIAIVPDFKATTYTNQIYQNYKNFPALTISATIGVSVNLGKPVSKPKPSNVEVVTQPVTVVVPEVRPQIIRDTVIVERIVRDTVSRLVKPAEPTGNHDIDHPVITSISVSALFDTAKDVIRPEAKPELMAVVEWMRNNPGVGILVEGHTDSVGGKDYNLNLSLRRAQSVKNFLVSHGVRPSLITIKGYGFDRPVATNSTPDGRQLNRRVEVRLR
ncbi:MAG: OmpA family protein [Bacteroidales bacterium]|nr:OmpA family protein [Bacteroidales bacterium]